MSELPPEVLPAGTTPLNYASLATARRGWSLGKVFTILGLWFLGFLLLAAIVIPNMGRARPAAQQIKCANNLRQIALACQQYAQDHGGRFPDSLGVVFLAEDIPAEVFICPECNHTPATGPTTQAVVNNLTAGGHLSYLYVGKGLTNAAGRTTVLLYEPLSNHRGRGINVIYADASRDWFPAPVAAKVIAELQSGHNPPRPGMIRLTAQ